MKYSISSMWGSLQTTASVKDQTTEHTHTHTHPSTAPKQTQWGSAERGCFFTAGQAQPTASVQTLCRASVSQTLTSSHVYTCSWSPVTNLQKKYHSFSQPKPRRVPIPFLKENKTQWLSLMEQRRNHVHLRQLSREPSPASLSALHLHRTPSSQVKSCHISLVRHLAWISVAMLTKDFGLSYPTAPHH